MATAGVVVLNSITIKLEWQGDQAFFNFFRSALQGPYIRDFVRARRINKEAFRIVNGHPVQRGLG